MKQIRLLTFSLFTALLLWANPCPAQQATGDVTPPAQVTESEAADEVLSAGQETDLAGTNSALVSLLEAVSRTREEIVETEAGLEAATSDSEQQLLRSRLEELNQTLIRQQGNLFALSVGLSEDFLSPPSADDLDWRQELQDLVGPILRELRDLTERPRQLEMLRTEIEFKQDQLPKLEQALTRLDRLAARAEDARLIEYLQQQRGDWDVEREQLLNDIEVAELKLEQIEAEEESLTDSAQQLFERFFKSRGLNLLLAVLGFLIVFVGLRFGYALLRRHSRLDRLGGQSFYLRLTDIITYALVLFLAAFAALAVLYTSGDWVLLGLAIILLIGIAWSAKEGINRYWEQTKLLLNVGSVREGERIIHDGLPWLVEKLNYYTTLRNPALTGGRTRVRLDELISRASRPFDGTEPWFPTDEGDWVILDDGTYGRVMTQTPEVVRLVQYGTMVKSYPATDFLAMRPTNLSGGFTLHVVFGVDYQHQANVTTGIPDTLKAAVEEAVSLRPKGEMCKGVRAEFKEAGSSSLDISLFVSFHGDAASEYYPMTRATQRACVDACTTNGWVIPFPQLTVHRGDT